MERTSLRGWGRFLSEKRSGISCPEDGFIVTNVTMEEEAGPRMSSFPNSVIGRGICAIHNKGWEGGNTAIIPVTRHLWIWISCRLINIWVRCSIMRVLSPVSTTPPNYGSLLAQQEQRESPVASPASNGICTIVKMWGYMYLDPHTIKAKRRLNIQVNNPCGFNMQALAN